MLKCCEVRNGPTTPALGARIATKIQKYSSTVPAAVETYFVPLRYLLKKAQLNFYKKIVKFNCSLVMSKVVLEMCALVLSKFVCLFLAYIHKITNACLSMCIWVFFILPLWKKEYNSCFWGAKNFKFNQICKRYQRPWFQKLFGDISVNIIFL